MNEQAVPGYTKLKTLGAGGFGRVVLARHDATGTMVAIKYLRADLLGDPDFAALFRGEAEVLGSLSDPCAVRLYEYLEWPGGAAIVMELVDGTTVREILRRYGKTSPEAAIVVLYGSLLGLAAAHARGGAPGLQAGERAGERARGEQADGLRHRRAIRDQAGERGVARLRAARAVRRHAREPG